MFQSCVQCLLCLSLMLLAFAQDNSKILCSQDYCEIYQQHHVCAAIPYACRIQNFTYNGQFFPSPEPCNCCNFCLQNLKLGEACANGEPGQPNPTAICADGLQCVNDVCEIMDDTDCTKKQKYWDKLDKEGIQGQTVMRPTCDKEGNFQPLICILGEICFCVDKEGSRLFGEIPYGESTQNKQCGCSRNIAKIDQILDKHEYSFKQFRCKPNGNFDRLQCINSTCMCVDEKDGYPLNSHVEMVNIKNISTLSCYDKNSHEDGYFRSCQKELKEKTEEIEEYKKQGYTLFGVHLPNCQLDGRFAAVQENSHSKFCADQDRKLIENFSISKKNILASTMNCKCARSRTIVFGDEKPECCENGNYKSIQCRRGFCRCVDTNGIQTVKEVPGDKIKELKCYNKTCTQ